VRRSDVAVALPVPVPVPPSSPASTIVLNSIWYLLLKDFNGKHTDIQSHHVKDLVLVATILTGVVGFITITRGHDYVHKYLVSGPVGNGVVMAHVPPRAVFIFSQREARARTGHGKGASRQQRRCVYG
jgi:hypothetical protein